MRSKLPVIGGGLIFVLVVVLMVLGVKSYLAYRAKCTDNGGHWERYNCRNVTTFKCSYDYSDGSLQECHTETHETCDEKCVGANAEAHE